MSKSELFDAYITIRSKWQSEAEGSTTLKRHRSLELQVNSLTPLSTSVLKTDDSIFYFDNTILSTWKKEFKHLLQTRLNQQDFDLPHAHVSREEEDDAIYELHLAPTADYGVDIEGVRVGLGPNPPIDQLFSTVNAFFTLNEKQGLVVKNVLKAVLSLDTSQQCTVIESDQQFLLYIGGCRLSSL